MSVIGAYIRQRREARKISLRDLATRLDLSPSYISDIELGRRYPSEEVLKKIAVALGESVSTLRAQDDRAPLDEIKRITETDPRFAAALRVLIDKKITGDDLLNILEAESKKKH